jgi:hypothetical protein
MCSPIARGSHRYETSCLALARPAQFAVDLPSIAPTEVQRAGDQDAAHRVDELALLAL